MNRPRSHSHALPPARRSPARHANQDDPALLPRLMRRPRPRRLVSWALGLLLGSLGAGPALAQAPVSGPSFEVSAQVPIQDDAARARGRALLDAMNQALEQAVAQAAPEARGRLYLLSPRARDYITTYRVLEEGDSDGQFVLRLAAQVDLPRLLRDLQGTVPVSRQVSGRRLALLLCATPSVDGSGGQAAELDALAAAAVDKARTLLSASGETVELLSAAQCSPAAGANPAVLGKSPAHALLGLTLQGSNRSEEVRGTQPRLFGALGHATWRAVPLRAAAAGTDTTLSETVETPAFAETAEAAAMEAQQRSAATALGLLLKRPGVLPYSGSSVLVSILGAGSYANYQQLLRVLGALPGVLRAEPRRFVPARAAGAEASDDLIQVLVHTAASPESLGAALGRTPLSGLRLQVAPQGVGELRVLCAPGSALPPETPPGLPTDPLPPESSEPAAPPARPSP